MHKNKTLQFSAETVRSFRLDCTVLERIALCQPGEIVHPHRHIEECVLVESS